MKIKIGNRKFLEQLLKTYIIIVCIFSFIVSITLVAWNNSNAYKQFDSENNKNLDTYSRHYDNELSLCKSLMDNIQLSKEFQNYVKALYGGESISVQKLLLCNKLKENELYNTVNMSFAITSIIDEGVICAGSTTTLTEFARIKNLPNSVWEDIKNAFSKNPLNNYAFLSYNTKFIAVRKYTLYDNNMYTIAIGYNDKLFDDKAIEKNSGFAVLYKNDVLVSSAEDDSERQKIIKNINSINNKTEKSEKSFKKGRNHIYVAGSGYSDQIKYVMITRYKTNILTAIFMGLRAVFAMALLVLAGLWISYKSAMSIYQPIDNILDTVKKYDDDSGEVDDELDYINKILKNLVVDNDNFRQTADTGKKIMKQRFISDLLQGLYSGEDVQQQLATYDIKFLQKGARVILAEITSKREMEENFSRSQIAGIKQAIVNHLDERVNSYSLCEIIELDNYKIGVLVSVPQDDKALAMVQSVFAEFTISVDMIVAVGNYCEKINQLNNSYENALSMLDTHFINPQKMIFTMEDLKNKKNTGYFYPIDTERNLINYAVAGEHDNAMRILKNVLDRNLIEQRVNATDQFDFAIVSTIKRILQQADKREEEAFEEGKILYLELRACKTNHELYEKTVEIFEQLLSVLSQDSMNKANLTFNKIIKYINEHYCEDISLQDIASRFNISVGYIGMLVSENLNVSFKNYLNGLRIEKSKEILKENENIKIQDIPAMVGFNNSVTFLRVFKKYEGLSPTEYIRKIRGEE